MEFSFINSAIFIHNYTWYYNKGYLCRASSCWGSALSIFCFHFLLCGHLLLQINEWVLSDLEAAYYIFGRKYKFSIGLKTKYCLFILNMLLFVALIFQHLIQHR
jgi:hypothetical protein